MSTISACGLPWTLRIYHRLLSIHSSVATILFRVTLLLAIGLGMVSPSTASAQSTLYTQNAFVGAAESNGLLTIYQGNPLNDNGLTFAGESFMTIDVGGVYYSNNINVNGVVNVGFPTRNTEIGDTIRSTWKEQGFDIVQNVYPVAFNNSGVIVISYEIVNHGSDNLSCQAQFLLDNDNSLSAGGTGNDAPYTITNHGYISNTACWQTCPPSPIPSFDLTFQNAPSTANLGNVGIGYFDDTYTPRPLGLLAPTLVQFGYWPEMVFVPWGPSPTSANYKDNATLIMGSPTQTPNPLSGDSVAEIFRTAFGTPEWCLDHGQLVGVAMYPEHIVWNPGTMTYSPNPFPVQAFLFTDDAGAASGVALRQTVSNPIHIITPAPAVGSPNTQLQVAGAIGFESVAIVNWMDTVEILPSACTGPFPVSIDFDARMTGIATGADSPVFVHSWGCDITVDCAHPDITPPKYKNSFTGCDSVQNDTLTVHDDTLYDTGLQNITYTSPDLKAAQYSVTINPPPPYMCIDSSVKIYVRQVDSVHGGHIIFTYTDCANNVSKDTVCFMAHPPIPDLTAPHFWIDYSNVADCHAQCTQLTVTDSMKSDTSIDRGVVSIITVSNTNMALSGVPNGGKYPTDTPAVSFSVCVKDSLLDGIIILDANDSSHNSRLDTITYCTTPDTLPPIVTDSVLDSANGLWHVHVTETRPWDRGIDSVWLEDSSNVMTVPTVLGNPLGCIRTFDFNIKVTDTSKCATATIYARDCDSNVSSPTVLSFSKSAAPVIVASKTTLCNATDSATLDAGAGYTGYLWSNGQTTEKITVGQGNYFVTVQEGAGCPATSKTLAITLSPATPQITPAGPISICSPDSAQLDGGAGFTTYQWMNDGSLIASQTSEKIWATTSGNYTVQVTNAAGCMGTSTAVSVTINPLPAQPTISSTNNVLTATTTTPGVTYQWSLNGSTLNGAASQTYTPLVGGSYTVSVTDANGCSNTSVPFNNAGSTIIAVPAMVLAQESNQIIIPLNVLSSQTVPAGNMNYTVIIAFNRTLLVPTTPPAGVTLVSSTIKGDSLIVEYTGTGPATQGVLGNLPFIAALGDDSCTTVTIDSFAWSTANIAVTVQNGNFCLTNLCYQGGIQLIDPNATASLSDPVPNPAFSSIQINYTLIEKGQTSLIIYDVLGREALRLVDATMTPGNYTVVADVSMLPAGTYVYSLRTPTIVKSDHLEISR